MVDISVIITAHREGLLAGLSARSAQAAMTVAEASGLRCEMIAVLDRADALTTQLFTGLSQGELTVLESEFGDPGLARNHGVAAARARCATFLDADDLWSENWLVEAWRCAQERPDAIFHSACNLVFGDKRLLHWHVDSEDALCDHAYLEWLNYWDAMCFARTEHLRRYPFKANKLDSGFGHEDWHWNAWTISVGVPHKPVPNTMHFKRARGDTQTSRVERVGGVRWPLDSENMRNCTSREASQSREQETGNQ